MSKGGGRRSGWCVFCEVGIWYFGEVFRVGVGSREGEELREVDEMNGC